MAFLCLYCKDRNSIAPSVVEFARHGSGPHATVFFICPDCHNKFMINIEDLGKIKKLNDDLLDALRLSLKGYHIV